MDKTKQVIDFEPRRFHVAQERSRIGAVSASPVPCDGAGCGGVCDQHIVGHLHRRQPPDATGAEILRARLFAPSIANFFDFRLGDVVALLGRDVVVDAKGLFLQASRITKPIVLGITDMSINVSRLIASA